jgi:DNA-binding NarL/FixJ family response regulator
MKPIKVLVVDHNVLMLDVLKICFKNHADISIIGYCQTGNEAIQESIVLKPDIIVINDDVLEFSVWMLIEIITKQKIKSKIIVLSDHKEELYIHKALMAGIKAYLLKSQGYDELIRAIYAVYNGGQYFANEIIDFVESFRHTKPTKMLLYSELNDVVTKREIEIVSLIKDGCTSQVIADKLFVSKRTIDSHRTNMIKKYKVKNASELIHLFIDNHFFA